MGPNFTIISVLETANGRKVSETRKFQTPMIPKLSARLRASTELGGDVVDVAVAPRLTRFGAADQRVVEVTLVLASVPVGRRIAASDVAAVEAHPEVDPCVSRLQTFLAAGNFVRYGQNLDPLVVFAPWHSFPFSCV
jgi:hypothetical protein